MKVIGTVLGSYGSKTSRMDIQNNIYYNAAIYHSVSSQLPTHSKSNGEHNLLTQPSFIVLSCPYCRRKVNLSRHVPVARPTITTTTSLEGIQETSNITGNELFGNRLLTRSNTTSAAASGICNGLYSNDTENVYKDTLPPPPPTSTYDISNMTENVHKNTTTTPLFSCRNCKLNALYKYELRPLYYMLVKVKLSNKENTVLMLSLYGDVLDKLFGGPVELFVKELSKLRVMYSLFNDGDGDGSASNASNPNQSSGFTAFVNKTVQSYIVGCDFLFSLRDGFAKYASNIEFNSQPRNGYKTILDLLTYQVIGDGIDAEADLLDVFVPVTANESDTKKIKSIKPTYNNPPPKQTSYIVVPRAKRRQGHLKRLELSSSVFKRKKLSSIDVAYFVKNGTIK